MLGTNIGIDLGTTSILIFVEGKGIVVSEPSAVAFDTDTGRLLAVGQKAADMIGRNPDSITVVKPMRSGVISDFTATKAIVRVLLYKVCKNMVFKPNIVVCMPSTVTNLEKRTILDLVTAAGAGRACLIEEPLAAALGAGLDIRRPMGTMVVDIGGGTADIAIVTTPTVRSASLSETPLRSVREVAICSPAFKELLGRKISLADLGNYPLISLGTSTKSFEFYSAFFTEHGLPYSPDIEAATADQILPMAQADLGVGFVPEEFVNPSDNVRIIDLEEEIPERSICLIKRKEQPLSVAAKELERMIIELASGE